MSHQAICWIAHLQELANVVEDASAPQHRLHDATEVVILHLTATAFSQAMACTRLLTELQGLGVGAVGGFRGGGAGRKKGPGRLSIQPSHASSNSQGNVPSGVLNYK